MVIRWSARSFAEVSEQLRRDNRDLAEHLELAIANIQRLASGHHRQRRAPEKADNITRIDTNRTSNQASAAPVSPESARVRSSCAA
jgi:hypothetical protein